MPIHNEWLLQSVKRYGFDNVDEVLRHLIYIANSEPKLIKKLIFKTVRCLHCHVGARADQHVKIDLGTNNNNNNNNSDNENKSNTRIAIHTFHYEWLSRVTESCKIASVEKSVRIIIDYYQSRVKQVFHSDGQEAASKKELELFGRNRHDDPRYTAVVLQQEQEQGLLLNDPSLSKENENENEHQPKKDGTVPAEAEEESDDPAACSQQDMIEAIKRCQVGRNSTSYAVAMKETSEETKARRTKEILIEESDETKLARIQIRQALGSPMG